MAPRIEPHIAEVVELVKLFPGSTAPHIGQACREHRKAIYSLSTAKRLGLVRAVRSQDKWHVSHWFYDGENIKEDIIKPHNWTALHMVDSTGRSLCGYENVSRVTEDPHEATCYRCKRTVEYHHRRHPGKVKVVESVAEVVRLVSMFPGSTASHIGQACIVSREVDWSLREARKLGLVTSKRSRFPGRVHVWFPTNIQKGDDT